MYDALDHPRVRGADGQRRDREQACRWSIPACAGPIADERSGTSSTVVHPRVRAGPMAVAASGSTTSQVHPRVRGADHHDAAKHDPKTGPSPRARGRFGVDADGENESRSIPACAGPMDGDPSEMTRQLVHPRVRGADPPRTRANSPATGPSPRARGRCSAVGDGGGPRGSIPACAGPIAGATPPRRVPEVHPRVRGADSRRAPAHRGGAGPSPRARGRSPDPPRENDHEGSIPACAGPIVSSPAAGVTSPVHPRVRGADTC